MPPRPTRARFTIEENIDDTDLRSGWDNLTEAAAEGLNKWLKDDEH